MSEDEHPPTQPDSEKHDPGALGVRAEALPPLPDDLLTRPDAAHLDPRAWFLHPDRPFEIEIGCGKGTFLLNQASAESATNFLGIEYAGEYWAYTGDRCRRAGLTNVRVLYADAVDFVRWRVPDSIVRVIHLYFSDPWPKRRHHKNRVVQDRFLRDCWRVLVPAGELRIVTDHEEYWEWMQEKFAKVAQGPGALFERLEFETPAAAREGELVGSNFERKYRREGRPFYSCRLRRLESVPTEPTHATNRAGSVP
ncbi:MAG: tRNA (guanosine(46)-N7)-methyltransferase TrmB [Planctomycetota bacterium]|nr:tRNA (guanosine(46)-N7)-methyltransferase TrmB [Planctomycetota bacterium]